MVGSNMTMVVAFAKALLVSQLLSCTLAAFTHSFQGVHEGETIVVGWDKVDAKYLPLTLWAQLLNSSISGNSPKVTSVIKANLTVGMNASSFIWANVPSPLPFLETAQYQVELFPSNWDQSAQLSKPVLANSKLFTVKASGVEESIDGSATAAAAKPPSPSPDNRPLNVGLGVGITSALALGVILFWWRRKVRLARRSVVFTEKKQRIQVKRMTIS